MDVPDGWGERIRESVLSVLLDDEKFARENVTTIMKIRREILS